MLAEAKATQYVPSNPLSLPSKGASVQSTLSLAYIGVWQQCVVDIGTDGGRCERSALYDCTQGGPGLSCRISL